MLAYGIAQQSKDCAKGIQNSFAKYPTAKVAYFDDSLGYAQPLGAQVTAMKQKGVTFVMTCVDLQESFTLGKEMQKQGMHAVQSLPNGYDPNFVSKNAALLEGDIVTLLFVALEVTPQIPEIQNLYKYTAEIGVPVSELTVYGWILASELYAGLADAGPNFSQAAVVMRSTGRRRSATTVSSRRSTGPRATSTPRSTPRRSAPRSAPTR